jgi:hypothetical protein
VKLNKIAQTENVNKAQVQKPIVESLNEGMSTAQRRLSDYQFNMQNIHSL